MHPFRLLQHVEEAKQVPTILVRALPVPLGKTQEVQIRESYKTLGVDEFFNLYDEGNRAGREAALEAFRQAVVSRLPYRPASEQPAGP
jgi:hypothetical protein